VVHHDSAVLSAECDGVNHVTWSNPHNSPITPPFIYPKEVTVLALHQAPFLALFWLP